MWRSPVQHRHTPRWRYAVARRNSALGWVGADLSRPCTPANRASNYGQPPVGAHSGESGGNRQLKELKKKSAWQIWANLVHAKSLGRKPLQGRGLCGSISSTALQSSTAAVHFSSLRWHWPRFRRQASSKPRTRSARWSGHRPPRRSTAAEYLEAGTRRDHVS